MYTDPLGTKWTYKKFSDDCLNDCVTINKYLNDNKASNPQLGTVYSYYPNKNEFLTNYSSVLNEVLYTNPKRSKKY